MRSANAVAIQLPINAPPGPETAYQIPVIPATFSVRVISSAISESVRHCRQHGQRIHVDANEDSNSNTGRNSQRDQACGNSDCDPVRSSRRASEQEAPGIGSHYHEADEYQDCRDHAERAHTTLHRRHGQPVVDQASGP